MATEGRLDETALVARIIAELQANPDAQRLLLRALLTNEFLGMPARLDRVEKDIAELKADVAVLKADVAELKTDVAVLKTDVAVLKTDVADLKGSNLELRLHRKLRPLACRALALKRPHIVQSPIQETDREFLVHVEEAVENDVITEVQDDRIEATDFIMKAQRRNDPLPVWVAVEASNKIHAKDIERARATADALDAMFEGSALAVVAGYRIDPPDAERAKASGVRYVPVAPADRI